VRNGRIGNSARICVLPEENKRVPTGGKILILRFFSAFISLIFWLSAAIPPFSFSDSTLILYSKEGKKIAVMTHKGAFMAKEQMIFLQPEVTLLEKDGGWKMTAERAVSPRTAEDWLLEGNVRGNRKTSDFSFQTSSVHYSTESKKLWGKERIKVDYGGLILEGVGFELDLNLQRLHVEKEVTLRNAPEK